MSESNSILKPCAFCGGVKLIVGNQKEIAGLEDSSKYLAVCCDMIQGGCGAVSGYRETYEEAVEAWNRRAGDE